MGRIRGIGCNIAALIGLIACFGAISLAQGAPATVDDRVPMAVSVHRHAAQPNDLKYLLAQAGAPGESGTPALPDTKKPQDQPSPAAASPASATSIAEVPRAERTVPGCALKYMAAELSGKLQGRKWKEFRQQECGASTVEVVFPATIAPKYSGDDPERARTRTCADQFSANKATNGNGGLKWIEKSGGYYSECVVRLKG